MALWDSISVYIGPSPRERQEQERNDWWEKFQTIPPAPTASTVGPCPTIIRIVGEGGRVVRRFWVNFQGVLLIPWNHRRKLNCFDKMLQGSGKSLTFDSVYTYYFIIIYMYIVLVDTCRQIIQVDKILLLAESLYYLNSFHKIIIFTRVN